MIVNELEINHKRRHTEIMTLFNTLITNQVAHMNREKEEYMYFLDKNDPQIFTLEEELVNTHTQKLKEAILSTEEGVPSVFISLAIEMFDENIRDGLNQNK